MGFKGVLIDFGGTLAYVDEKTKTRYEKKLLSTVEKCGYQRNLSDLTSNLADTYGNSTKGELKNLREFWDLFLRKLEIPRKTAIVDGLEKVRRAYVASVFRLYDKALPTLSVLQMRYKLALVSNCAIGTDEILTALGLTRFFNCILLSYKAEVRKPARRIYVEALKCLRLEAFECVFVADEISDLEGANAIGLKTILVRQGSSTFSEVKDPNFKPDFECNHISEITRFI